MTQTTTMSESNAIAWSQTILNLWDASQWCGDRRITCLGLNKETREILEDEGAEFDARSGQITDDCHPWDAIAASLNYRVQQSILCAQTRSAWHDPWSESSEDNEFRIQLTVGGPYLEISGELDACGCAQDPELIYAEMGREPARLRLDSAHQSALEWFALQFFCM
tara:strand:- start:773 stop:1270 length:498 start_codon:yes stop_codon:yes gene_type:complete